MLLRPAHFPDAVVGLAPGILQKREQGELDLPGVIAGRQAGVKGQVHRVHELAIDIQLRLGVSRVADAHGR